MVSGDRSGVLWDIERREFETRAKSEVCSTAFAMEEIYRLVWKR
jgi:hypothetical protein